ncbi:hypothetical protein GCM10011581_21510 [Saccharopolyspora subtropica]|uniref:Carrier domain-containing protein n=1 Tax=Saccharopolyspora thermophila TaxID=89367 RepID=A0A917JVA9_9PSEU|nr:amino acid adenylation domain-containing protein [Saccharopolyspora subtropica]GGI83992.1 hypothetical protein GCM10011581_21510 [Saccharopolyspora subtropica]
MNRSSAERRAFWTKVLEGAAFTPIPRWHGPEPEPPSTACHELELPAATTQRLRSTAEALGVPVSTLALAAHVKVIAAVTGEPQVVTGFLVDGGDPAPCSVRLPDGSWRALVARVHNVAEEIRAHLPAELGGTVFDTVLDLTAAAGELGDVVLRTGFTAETGLLRLQHRADLLNASQVHRIGGYYLAALDQLTTDLDAPHNAASLLSAEEHHYQIFGLAGPRRDLPEQRVHELFEARVQRHPDAVAAVYRDQRWTYRQLNERANQIAHALLARGLRAEDVVAVVTDRNLDWMASVLGVFKAGGCYLPVEPDFPADRIARTLRRSDCQFALAEVGRTANLDGADVDVEVLPLRDIGGDTTNPGVPVAADQLAYVYFTSGSTGEPKGAMCEHAGMINHLFAKIHDLGIAEGAVVAQTAPQCFDISLWQLVSALLVGGRTVLIEQDVILDVQRFVDKIAEHRVQILQLVPSYLETVLTYLEDSPRELPALECVSVTGEALKKELTQRWFATYPGLKLANVYGLTETSDDTNHEVMTEVPVRDRVPLGPPVQNTHVYVVDPDLRPVPLGAPGEIVFSGVCVGRGYINDPERTAAAFLEDPHRPGNRLYRSGDFGRWLPEGKLEFLGRRDAQVKIRGFRIEIGEIENQLLRVPGVRDGAVVVTEDGGGNKNLVAFYTGPERLDPEEFKRLLSRGLPHYMVPDHFHHVEALPLTANGKTDKKALTRLAAERAAEDSAAHQPPRTPTERDLAAKWAEALGVAVDQVGRTDHFFDRGGTSLSAVKLVIKLERRVSLKDVTANPVLADLAAVLDGRTAAGTGVLQQLSVADGSRHGLVVFPYAGGGPVNFHAFAHALRAAGISTYAVQLPGHDLGADAGAFAGLEQTAADVVAEIGKLGLETISLWGHSAGAAFAVHAARLLEQQGTRVHQVIVGARALNSVEELQRDIAELDALSTEDIKQRLGAEAAFRELDRLRPEHAANVAEAYRHDVRVAARYLLDLQTAPPRRLSAPLTVVFAEGDAGLAEGLASPWEVVAQHVERRRISGGGHYFLATHATEAAAVVRPATENPAPQPTGKVRPMASAELDVVTAADKPAVLRVGDVADATAWTAEHRAELRSLVDEHGALLIRGLRLTNAADFGRVARELAAPLMQEREAFARRWTYEDGVYSSSKWPPNQPMCMHHELSYTLEIPGLMLFSCLDAPDSGGVTGVADASAVLEALPADLVERFEREGWQLLRHYNEMVGVPWQEAFGTDDRAAVERYCRDNAIEFEWDGADGLRTRQRRSAILTHPKTGKRVWFNQVAFLNEWTIDPEVRDYLVMEFGPDGLPFNSRYGNGDPIGDDVIALLNKVYEEHTQREPWQAGDLMLVDNIARAHSREPYEGSREVLVAMGDPVRVADCAPTVALS